MVAKRPPRERRRPGGFTWPAADPTILALYNASDRAAGEERRELNRLAGELRRAMDRKAPAEELGQLRQAAQRRLGLLLL